jgi:hypothetical protein
MMNNKIHSNKFLDLFQKAIQEKKSKKEIIIMVMKFNLDMHIIKIMIFEL